MGTWNLRVIHNDIKIGQNKLISLKKEDTYYFIAEVYYDDKGNHIGYTHENGVNMLASTREELQEYYKLIADAFDKSTINLSEFHKTN